MGSDERRQASAARRAVIRRRLVTIPRTLALLVVTTVLAPVIVMVAAVVDAVRRIGAPGRPAMTLRLAAFAWVYLAAETIGIVWLFVQWLASGFGTNRSRLVTSTWPIQRWWARTLFGAARTLFDLRLEADGLDAAVPGPIIVMFRHASIIDNLLPAVLMTDGLGLELRWVVKRELLDLPALDIAGGRLPNHFVDRTAADPDAEIAAIRALATDLGPNEGVLIFPEGTRYTPDKARRALAALDSGDPRLAELARRMRHVLPPRPGGALALIDSGADVMVVGHEGLGGLAGIADIWSGSLVGRTIRVSGRRFLGRDIPRGESARAAWLFERWLEIDDWIDEQKGEAQAS